MNLASAVRRHRRLGLGLCLAAVLTAIPVRASKSVFLRQIPSAPSPATLVADEGKRIGGDPDGGRVFLERMRRAVEAPERATPDAVVDAPLAAPAPVPSEPVELGKPAYLKIYLLATPKNPRSPPA
jgi:hypothetical protein